jgi:hypothetical protein
MLGMRRAGDAFTGSIRRATTCTGDLDQVDDRRARVDAAPVVNVAWMEHSSKHCRDPVERSHEQRMRRRHACGTTTIAGAILLIGAEPRGRLARHSIEWIFRPDFVPRDQLDWLFRRAEDVRRVQARGVHDLGSSMKMPVIVWCNT